MKRMLTLTEAGERTNHSPKGVRQLIAKGKFPFSKVGGRIVIDEGELDLFLTLCRKTSAEAAAATVKEEWT